MIRLGFFGAAGEVTGSCYSLSTDRARILVDMGMHQGEQVADEHNRRMPDVDPRTLHAVVLTHAHLDHCGRLPMLVKAGFTGPIYSTAPSCDLTEIILRDSASLQESDSERYNRRFLRPGQAPQTPLYTSSDVERTLKLLRPVRYNQPIEVAPGMTANWVEAGHILGSASVPIRVHDGARTVNIAFSGDIGVMGAPLLRDPQTPGPADVVVMESTYGDRDHRSLEATTQELLQVLRHADSCRGKILIPAFAVGRTQDLIYHMAAFVRAGMLPRLNVYVDSPMANQTTNLYRTYREVYDDEATKLLQNNGSPLSFPGLHYTQSIEDSKRLNDSNECMVIIAASGMCTGGRIVHHLMHNLHKPETQVVIVGYQGQGTLGRRLVDGAQRVRIFGEDVVVRAKIHTLGGFSAHAGQSGLLRWASPFAQSRPRMYLTHGEDAPRNTLRDRLKSDLGLDPILPRYGDIAEL